METQHFTNYSSYDQIFDIKIGIRRKEKQSST